MKLLVTILLTGFLCLSVSAQENSKNPQLKENIESPKGVQIAYLNDGSLIEFNTISDLISKKDQVISIMIQFQDLKAVPEELKMFTNVELIDISNNQISELDVNFFKSFTKLTRLYINQNELTESSLPKIEEELKGVQVFHSKSQNN